MAIDDLCGDSEAETPLLSETLYGVVNFKGLPVLRSTSGGWKAAAFIISNIYSVFFFFLVGVLFSYCVLIYFYFYIYMTISSCGSGWEICLLWNQLEPDKLFDGATWSIHGNGSRERQPLVWNSVITSSSRRFSCWFFSWSLPHHRFSFPYLCSGILNSPISFISLMFQLKLSNDAN